MILHLTAGRGPAECRLAVAGLLRRLVDEARAAGLEAEVLESVPAKEGLLSALVELSGEGTATFAAGWQGSLLWTCPSPLRPAARRKNWFVSAGIVVVPEAGTPGFSEQDLRWETFRSSGAGGQHVNKTDSAVRLRHAPSGLVIEARQERSQHRNRALALAKLALALNQREATETETAERNIWGRNAAIDDRGRDVACRVYRGPSFERMR